MNYKYNNMKKSKYDPLDITNRLHRHSKKAPN